MCQFLSIVTNFGKDILRKTHAETPTSLGSIFIPEKYVFKACFESPFTRMISSLQWRHQGGGDGGICPPPSEALPPHLPPPRHKKKMAKISHFRHFFGFLPPQKRILPPRCPPPQKKFWCRHCQPGIQVPPPPPPGKILRYWRFRPRAAAAHPHQKIIRVPGPPGKKVSSRFVTRIASRTGLFG